MLFAFFTKRPKRRKSCLLGAIILFFFFSNQFIFNEVVRLWETQTISMEDIEEPYDVGILLGGYSNPNIVSIDNRHNFSERGNRFANAYELYRKGKIKKVLLTGGSGRLIENQYSEAAKMQEYLEEIGIPKEDFIIEANSRNTYENALFTKRIIENAYPNARCLLITSAWHMPRSMKCFEKQNLKITPFSVDFLSETRRFLPETLILPSRLGFYRWEMLIKEWVGIMAYRIRGYI